MGSLEAIIMIIHVEQNGVSSSCLAHYEGEALWRAGWLGKNRFSYFFLY
jgi:hypothetical protein